MIKLQRNQIKQKINNSLEDLIIKKNKSNEESKCDEDYINLTKDEIFLLSYMISP